MKNNLTVGVVVALTLVAAPTHAQLQSTVTLSRSTGQTSTVGQRECQSGDSVSVNYVVSPFYENTKLQIWVTTTNNCGDTPASGDKQLTSGKVTVTSTTTSGTLSFLISDVVADCPADTTKDLTICATTWNLSSTGAETVSNHANITVTYSSKRPATPKITGAGEGDRAIHLSWSAPVDVAKWIIYYTPSGAPIDATSQDPCTPPETDAGSELDAGVADAGVADADVPDSGAPQTQDAGESADAGDGGSADAGEVDTSIDVGSWLHKTVDNGTVRATDLTGLTNEQPYRIRMVAIDAADNTSFQSNEVTATPHLVQDFYRRYRCAGGKERGGFGCSAAGAAATLIPVAGLAVAALLRRRAARRPE